MDQQRTDIVIEWDLTEDPDFSVHKALTDAIYAAHEPLTGFLGVVFGAIWGAIKWVLGAVSAFAASEAGAVVISAAAAGLTTYLSGGTRGQSGISALYAGLAAYTGGAAYDEGGVFGLITDYAKRVLGYIPEDFRDSLDQIVGAFTDVYEGYYRQIWALARERIAEWFEYVRPAIEEAGELIEPFNRVITGYHRMLGLGNAWAEKRVSGEILAAAVKAPPEFGLMTDASLDTYIAELHELVKITPPIPPVSFPELNLDHLAPMTHQLWEKVTGIPKIIPAIEGVWNSIKDIWSIIKDTLIFTSNWLRYTFQETLNLILTGIGDISRYIGTSIVGLTEQLWNIAREGFTQVRGIISSLSSQIWQGINYAIEFLRSQLGWIREVLAGIPPYLGEVLHQVASGLYQVFSNLGSWLYEAFAALSSNLFRGITWVGEVIHSVFTEYLPTLFQWLWAQIRALGEWATSVAVPAIVQESKGAWAYVEEHFKQYTYMAYSAAENQLKQFMPMTPDKAPRAALGLLGVAIAFGMGAHTLSTVAELAHPLKEMGVHTLSAFMADMGNFGTIAASTMGILVAYSLRRPMGYYVNSLFRPTWPRAGDLMMMAVKPDISIEQFRRGMSYEGYSEEWINAYQRTMYREPRYFELSMMGEDEAATDEWIFRKARRGAYTPEDSVIFVKSLIKKVSRTQIIDAYRQAFYNYKEGYITRDQFRGYLDALEFRPEAKYYSVLAADLAYRLDYIGDMVTLLTNTYLNDLMGDDDFQVAIFSLGMEERKARIAIQKARIRKIPKVMQKVKKEAETQVREVQRKLQDVYREYYRAGRISEVEYEGYLVAIGMTPEMAELTVELEALRTERVAIEEAEREREKVQLKLQAEMVKKYKEQYEKGLISFEALVGSFILAGVDPELALAMAETEQVKLIPKPEAEA